ncbi:hypothetical protein [Pokkaliibacter plantistimulans]|uniref:hypothetical protein n=1 Tax=Pokkaliibacter plantistimulans TaxID=1635171 RepID=UPI0010579812|nr:hypothetical protein [Pokkaliibacter plantistimulans]
MRIDLVGIDGASCRLSGGQPGAVRTSPTPYLLHYRRSWEMAAEHRAARLAVSPVRFVPHRHPTSCTIAEGGKLWLNAVTAYYR